MAWLIVALPLATACHRAPEPTTAPQPAAREVAGSERPHPVPSAAPGETSAAWLLVAEDQVPYLTSPKSRPDKVEALLPAGLLVLPRTLVANDEHAKVTELDLNVRLVDAGEIKRKGAVRPIEHSRYGQGWTFSDALRPAPAGLPDRKALCQMLVQAQPPTFSAAACESVVNFMIIGSTERPRMLAAWGSQAPTSALLVVIDLDALAAGRPSIVERIASVALSALRQVAVPGGRTLLVAQQYRRKGNETGIEHALWLLDASGRVVQNLIFPKQTSEPNAVDVLQRTGRLTVTSGAQGPAVSVERDEFRQELATGRETSRIQTTEQAVWRGATARFEVLLYRKEPPK